MIKLQRASGVGSDIWFNVDDAYGDCHEGHTDNVAIKKLYSGNTARQRASGTGGMVSDRGREKKPLRN